MYIIVFFPRTGLPSCYFKFVAATSRSMSLIVYCRHIYSTGGFPLQIENGRNEKF